MNQEITLADYNSIGTMETALSEHADEAFFELSGERQKIAEKIFKCLTETDGENREIRRATTIEKLCAVADADFADVASVIEVFRKDGRTFLMPPPEVELNANSLIDISHESLIRKWGRLKNWVEEEGQSSRTYRRLAEDALLHKQEKMGFWSDPELKDALEWRENFKPNETWAQLYKETGERQYKASFADAMHYLDESEIKRDEEIAEERQQQDTLRKNARNLRWMLAGLGVFSILTIGAAIFAFNQMRRSDMLVQEVQRKIEESELARAEKENAFIKLDNNQKALVASKEALEANEEKLKTSLKNEQEAADNAELEKERANTKAREAILSEAEKEKALDQQKRLTDEAREAKDKADKERLLAEEAETRANESLKKANALTEREELNRTGLTLLEQGEFNQALPRFEKLLTLYEKESDEKERTDGRWWASHNLGIVYSKLDNYDLALRSYLSARSAIASAQKGTKDREDEINRSLATTFRRLGQLNREKAQNVTDEREAKMFNERAIGYYNNLLDILAKEPVDAKQPSYPADVYVELADSIVDLYDDDTYEAAQDYYEKAAETYRQDGDVIKQVSVLKKWANAALSYENADKANKLLRQAVNIQENKLSFVDLEIVDSYDKLAKVDPYLPQGNGAYIPLPYDKIARNTLDLNFAINTTGLGFYDDKYFRELADAYVGIGKCRRAEKIYQMAIEETKKPVEGKKLRDTFADLRLLAGQAEFYQNVLFDNDKAQKSINEFAVESGKRNLAENPNSILFDESFERAGDFYFAKGDYPQAGKLYENVLQAIEISLSDIEGPAEETEENKQAYILLLNLKKAEVLVKTARTAEKQSKFDEAEKKYALADSLATSKFGENGIEMAKILIPQADFYERRGNKKKAKEIYDKFETFLTALNKVPALNKFPKETLEFQIHILRKRGDMNRENTEIAAKYYEQAISNLNVYYSLYNLKQEEGSKEATRYSKNGKITKEYEIDMLEIYKSWASLNGVVNAVELNEEIERAQGTKDGAKESQCFEDK